MPQPATGYKNKLSAFGDDILKKKMPLWLVILLDILLAGAVMLTFALFHHVIPAWEAQQAIKDLALQTQATEPSIPSTQVLATDPTEETTEPDLRTPWQIRFEDRFTDEVVMTDRSYTSPEVSVTVDTVVTEIGGNPTTYYVADIYVASLDNFKTATAHDQFLYFDTQDAAEMAKYSNAILAISGDFLTYQKTGFLLRNGQVYVADRNYSICALFPDGTMETHDAYSYQIKDILDRDPVQVWSFGPVLLDEDGTVRDSYDVSTAVGYPNPRSAIGYYEPGHYCFVVVDGRQSHSVGLQIPQLAKIFEDLGCKKAYNLDGGGSAVMLFDGEKISKQSNGGRALGDILLITETGFHVTEGEE